MDHSVESYQHAGQTVEIFYDEDGSASDPRNNDNNMGTMVCWHDRSRLGDKQWDRADFPEFKNREAFFAWAKKETNAEIILPLYLFEHSGMTMRTTPFNDPWDSGQVGFIYATRETILQDMMVKTITAKTRQQVTENLESEVEEYDSWLKGEAYGYVVTPSDKRVEPESCWGFVGDLDFVKSDANDTAEALATAIANLPPTPYEIVVREASTGKEEVAAEDYHSWRTPINDAIEDAIMMLKG